MKITKNEAIKRSREGVKGTYYQLPDIEDGTMIAYAEFTGEHGESTIKDKFRIYYILDGEGKFIVDQQEVEVSEGDVVPIKEGSTYNIFPTSDVLKVILYMEYVDFEQK